jgi:cysteine desulfurase
MGAMQAAVYLDHNATTPMRPDAVAAMTATTARVGNPSSVHRYGRVARRIVEDAREQVAALVGAPPASVVFTSGGTEANAIAVRGCRGRRRFISAVEHASVAYNAEDAEIIPVDRAGIVDTERLEALLSARPKPAQVAVMLANNETGVIQPIGRIGEIVRRHGGRLHCDAAQAAGKIPVDWASLGVDTLSLSAHKFGGPTGVGALVVAADTDVDPLFLGGGQERQRRAGTENLPGIAGFGAAAEAAARLDDGAAIGRLRDRLEARVRSATPEAVVYGASAARLPNTSSIGMPDAAAETQVIAFDLLGIAVSAGAACSSGKVGVSHVLRAMGVADADARCVIRVSLGWSTTEAEIERFLDAWRRIHRRAEATSPEVCVGD